MSTIDSRQLIILQQLCFFLLVADERAAKEMEFQRRQALRWETEEAIRAKRKRELERLAALHLEEADLLKRDAVQKRVVEEEKLVTLPLSAST